MSRPSPTYPPIAHQQQQHSAPLLLKVSPTSSAHRGSLAPEMTYEIGPGCSVTPYAQREQAMAETLAAPGQYDQPRKRQRLSYEQQPPPQGAVGRSGPDYNPGNYPLTSNFTTSYQNQALGPPGAGLKIDTASMTGNRGPSYGPVSSTTPHTQNQNYPTSVYPTSSPALHGYNRKTSGPQGSPHPNGTGIGGFAYPSSAGSTFQAQPNHFAPPGSSYASTSATSLFPVSSSPKYPTTYVLPTPGQPGYYSAPPAGQHGSNQNMSSEGFSAPNSAYGNQPQSAPYQQARTSNSNWGPQYQSNSIAFNVPSAGQRTSIPSPGSPHINGAASYVGADSSRPRSLLSASSSGASPIYASTSRFPESYAASQSHEPASSAGRPSADATESTSKSKRKTSDQNGGKSSAVFVTKLFNMLEDPDIKRSGLLKWSDDGAGFVCNDPTEFAKLVLPQYFKHSNWHSFVRQLNMYGFSKQVNDVFLTLTTPAQVPIAWEFRHATFRRDDPEGIASIKRRSVKQTNQIRLQLEQEAAHRQATTHGGYYSALSHDPQDRSAAGGDGRSTRPHTVSPSLQQQLSPYVGVRRTNYSMDPSGQAIYPIQSLPPSSDPGTRPPLFQYQPGPPTAPPGYPAHSADGYEYRQSAPAQPIYNPDYATAMPGAHAVPYPNLRPTPVNPYSAQPPAPANQLHLSLDQNRFPRAPAPPQGLSRPPGFSEGQQNIKQDHSVAALGQMRASGLLDNGQNSHPRQRFEDERKVSHLTSLAANINTLHDVGRSSQPNQSPIGSRNHSIASIASRQPQLDMLPPMQSNYDHNGNHQPQGYYRRRSGSAFAYKIDDSREAYQGREESPSSSAEKRSGSSSGSGGIKGLLN